MNNTIKKGIVFAVIAAAISGFSIYYNKLIIAKGMDPIIFNIIKNGGVSLVIFFLLLTTGNLSKLTTLTKSQWVKLTLIGIVGGSIPFVLYFTGLKEVSAINANLIQKSMFIWVAFLAIPFLGERLSAWQVLGYALVAWSNLFIGGFTGFKWTTGEFMIIAATLLWSVEIIITKATLGSMDNMVVSWGRMFMGTITLLCIAFLQNKTGLLIKVTPFQIVSLVGSITFLTGYVLAWHKALKFAPANIVTATLILATPITNILSSLFITHQIPNGQVLNILGSAIGILFIILLSKKALNHQPAGIS